MRNILLSLILVWWPGAALPAQDPEGADSDEMWAHLTERIATYSWSGEDSDSGVFELKSDPVLRYTDPVREFLGGGQLHLVLEGERPVAACSIWLNLDKNATVRELTTLSEERLVCRNANGDVVWQPQPAELLDVHLEAAEEPASNPARRLAQMRSCVRRFSATFYRRRDGDPSELRLLPQPIYRFADVGQGIIDAALFAFVQSTDPDLLLMISARTDPDSGKPAWTYSLARMNSGHLRVRLDDAVVHEYRDYRTNPRSQEDQYVEADDMKYPAP